MDYPKWEIRAFLESLNSKFNSVSAAVQGIKLYVQQIYLRIPDFITCRNIKSGF